MLRVLVCCLAIQSLSLRCVTLAFLRCLFVRSPMGFSFSISVFSLIWVPASFLDLPRDETDEDFMDARS